MSIANNLTFKALLTTVGRNTGKEHSVWAKAVTYNDKIYFSRRNPNSDWLKNAIANPQVRVEIDGEKISALKYTDKERQKEHRIVLEISLLTE